MQDPYYILTYNYMIGDAKGYTDEEVTLSVDNPFIERYVKLVDKLEPAEDTWGIVLEIQYLYSCKEEGKLSEDDYNFLARTMFAENLEEEEDDDAINYFKTEQENEWADEFYEGVRARSEYSFLVFQGVDLEYVDEYGKKHKTKISG